MPEIRIRCVLPVLALGLCLAWPARAVIIDLGDGTGNTSAPGDDPGWANVGTTPGGLTAIYIGYGWVLTANHVGLGDVVLGGETYEAVAGSYVQLENDTGPPPDLGVFRIDPKPSLPVLPISASTPSTSTDVVMIGHGRNRGSATSWNPPGPLGPYYGYEWGVGRSMRWGTNVVAGTGGTVAYTQAFYTSFTDTDGTTDEAQGANGDSGGPVFVENGSVWEVAGVMLAVAEYDGQPADLALYGNLTYAADLAAYRDQIIALTRPQCSDEVDNDGDELIDYPSDPGCFSLADPSERLAGLPGLSPWGLAVLAGLLAGTSVWMVRRQRLGSI